MVATCYSFMTIVLQLLRITQSAQEPLIAAAFCELFAVCSNGPTGICHIVPFLPNSLQKVLFIYNRTQKMKITQSLLTGGKLVANRRNVKSEKSRPTDGHKRSRNFLSETEVEQLLDAARKNRHSRQDNLLLLMLLMMYWHGLRVSEATAIKLADLNMQLNIPSPATACLRRGQDTPAAAEEPPKDRHRISGNPGASILFTIRGASARIRSTGVTLFETPRP